MFVPVLLLALALYTLPARAVSSGELGASATHLLSSSLVLIREKICFFFFFFFFFFLQVCVFFVASICLTHAALAQGMDYC